MVQLKGLMLRIREISSGEMSARAPRSPSCSLIKLHNAAKAKTIVTCVSREKFSLTVLRIKKQFLKTRKSTLSLFAPQHVGG